ncbi:MAG: diaminopimelate epimerase [Rhodospirillales bacterium]|nr:diaminopimelate epimerase [Rhodospirillales bacterium]
MSHIEFIKMHGLGNDFVVIDDRDGALALGPQAARAIANRRAGVGFDQLLILEQPRSDQADVFMRIRNPDGSEAQACGNGTRCVAALVMDELGRDQVTVETVAGLLASTRHSDGRVSVDMGPAGLEWRQIPLSRDVDTLHMGIAGNGLADPVGVNMGNPHAVFFVDDVAAIDLAGVGPLLEHDELFPEQANIEIVQLIGPDRLRMRVWERAAGITEACGSGACAAGVAAHRRGLTGRRVEVVLDGGSLQIEWRDDGHVLMTGPVATSFHGHLNPSLLKSPAAQAN